MNRTRIYTASLVVALAASGIALALTLGDADATAARAADPNDAAPTTAVPLSTRLADGEHVGRIVAAYVAPNELVFEPADLLVGDDAVAAAEADGNETADFYLRDHPESRTSEAVAADVRVTAVECAAGCQEGVPSDYETLTHDADGRGLYRLTVRDGMVVAIDAIYVP